MAMPGDDTMDVRSRPRPAAADPPAGQAPDMTVPEADLDPVIHVPARLPIVVTLAALPDGDSLSFSRLQQLLDLTPGNLITHLRKLQDAGYVTNLKSRQDGPARTSVSLTHAGRAALEQYTATLQRLLGQATAQLGE